MAKSKGIREARGCMYVGSFLALSSSAYCITALKNRERAATDHVSFPCRIPGQADSAPISAPSSGDTERTYAQPIANRGINLVVPCFCAPRFAQSEISVQPPTGRLGWLTHPYRSVQRPAYPSDQFAAVERSDSRRQLVSDRAGRGGAGDREQHRRRGAALWSAAGPTGAAARPRRRSAAQRRTGSRRGAGKREPAGRQRKQLRRRRAFRQATA